MNKQDNTPGYNKRLSICFDYDKNGKKIAYYWARGRFFRMSLANAENFIAQEQADLFVKQPW